MKAQDLIKMIDKLVERKMNKIRQQIREEVSSEINKAMGKILVEVLKESRKPSKQTEDVESIPTVTPIYTNNPRLNSVLAETARNFKPLQRVANSGTSLAELLDGGFDKVGDENEVAYEEQRQFPKPVVSDGTNMGFLKQIVSEGATTGTPQQSVLGTSAVPDVLKGVFKKDFRAVLRKIDEQKKNGSGGLINPSTVLSG